MNSLCAGSLTKTGDFQSPDGGANPTPALHISECSLGDVRDFVELNHYSRSVNGVKISQCFRVTIGADLVGAVIFGSLSTTAWKRFADAEKKVLELRRLVLLDHVPKNSESKVIGFTLRRIRKLFPEVEKVVSYADPNHGHSGVIYRASNFAYLGLSGRDSGYRDRETGKIYHSRALRTKYRGEFKPFVKKLREKWVNGQLEKIPLQGKHCYCFTLRVP